LTADPGILFWLFFFHYQTVTRQDHLRLHFYIVYCRICILPLPNIEQ
jgi:hypothetical protein